MVRLVIKFNLRSFTHLEVGEIEFLAHTVFLLLSEQSYIRHTVYENYVDNVGKDEGKQKRLLGIDVEQVGFVDLVR